MVGYAIVGGLFMGVCALGCFYCFIKWYIKGPKYHPVRRLSGETVIITGGTSGIGRETAFALSLCGARVILACRNVTKGHEVAGDIKSDTQGEIEVEQCDLASLSSVKRFCAKILETESKVSIIVNCAGVSHAPKWKTEAGFDYQLTVNYLSQFLICWLLQPLIKHSAPGARIVNVTCSPYRSGEIDVDKLFSDPSKYSSRAMSSLSKVCVGIYSSELARRLEGTGVAIYCVDPGPCNTNLGRYMRQSSGIIMAIIYKLFYWPWLRSAKNGAQSVIYCAVEQSIEEQTGSFYKNCSEVITSDEMENFRQGQLLWSTTEEVLGLR